ncbi:winged helix-turn-helix transcriptional regulator [Candidatus Woesearchaeota archaeon]|nr:winged helix-turn-helix transcriptional regulator [Candidatus Woesearchaeota archaeon]
MSISPRLISFIARGKKRREILAMLCQKPMSQPEIAKAAGMYKSHASRTLKELSQKKLIVCLNPKDRAFKFYKASSLGNKAVKEVDKVLKLQQTK